MTIVTCLGCVFTDSLSKATGDGELGAVLLGIGISMGSGDDPEEVEETLGEGDDGDETGAARAAGKMSAISPLGRRVGTS